MQKSSIILAALTLVCATVLPSGPAAAAVTQITTGAAEVRAFLPRSATSVYAAVYGGGLFKSADSGASWTRIPMPSNERYLTSIGGNNSSFVVVGAEEGLLRSADGTTNFTRVLHEPIAAVAVAPGSSSVVLAGIKGLGVVRSADAGVSFSQANNSGFTSLDIVALAFDPSNANMAYAAAKPNGQGVGGGVFKSINSGLSWTAIAPPAGLLSNNQVSSLVVDSGGKLYAGVLRTCNASFWPAGVCDGAGDVFSLVNGSPPWTAAGGPNPSAFYGVVSLHRDANTGTTIWAGSRGLGLLSGSNTTWSYAFSQNGDPNLFYTGINAATSLPGGSPVVIKAIKGAGIWRSIAVASPRIWSHINIVGADRVLSASGVANSSKILLGLYAGGVWTSSDSGITFSPPVVTPTLANFSFGNYVTAVNPFVSIWDLAASPINSNLIYAAAGGVGMFYSNDNPGLFRWNGTVWQGIGDTASTVLPWYGVVESGITLPSAQIYGIALNPSSHETVYAGFLTANGVLKRTGTTWSPVSVPGATPQVRSIVASSVSGRLLALPFDDKAVVSNNSGASFTQVSVSQTGFERLRFFSAAENPNNTAQWIAGTNKGVFISSDGASSWSRVSTAVFQQQSIPAVGFAVNGLAFAGDFDGNRYCSLNGGISWTALSPKLVAGVNAIRRIGSSLYYLTDGAGMFREDATTC